MIVDILIALLILNILVIAHELGHYILAKRNGIAVDEFAVGFGPTLLKKKWNGTWWMLKAIPFGGYNGLRGEQELEGEPIEPQGFAAASKWARLQVLVAGSLMNILVAVVAFYITVILYGWKVPVPIPIQPIGATITAAGDPNPIVLSYVADSPASKMNVALPFEILSINGTAVHNASDVVQAITSATKDPISMEVKDAKGTRAVQVTRGADKKIGIQVNDPAAALSYSNSLPDKLFSGVSHTLNMIILTKDMLGAMIQNALKTHNLNTLGYAFSGPVAVVAVVGEVVQTSPHVLADLANMTGLIGVSLAIFNLLPFPGLDGWHILLLGYEKLRGKRPNQQIVNYISVAGLLLLFVFAGLIMVKDVYFYFIR